jgi:hypothetical protein
MNKSLKEERASKKLQLGKKILTFFCINDHLTSVMLTTNDRPTYFFPISQCSYFKNAKGTSKALPKKFNSTFIPEEQTLFVETVL